MGIAFIWLTSRTNQMIILIQTRFRSEKDVAVLSSKANFVHLNLAKYRRLSKGLPEKYHLLCASTSVFN